MGKDFSPDDTDAIRRAAIVLGDQGVGKTFLAATSDAPYFLDVEGRAEHAHVSRFVPAQNGAGWEELVVRVSELQNAKRLEGGFGITFKEKEVRTVVLDTVDRAQELLRMKNSGMLDPRNKQKFYGILLDRMLHDLVWPILSLPVNVIVIGHTAEKGLDVIEKEEVDKKNASIVPETTLALEGQLRRRLWNYFDNAFHMVRKQNGETIILTTSQIYEGRFLMAKDKRWLFGGKTIDVKWVKGQIESDAMSKVFANMHTLGERKNLVDQVRKAVMEEAVASGIMADAKDAKGGKIIAEQVMPKLQPYLETITSTSLEETLTLGKELVHELVK